MLERLERFAEPLLLMAAESAAATAAAEASAAQLLVQQQCDAACLHASQNAGSLYSSSSLAEDAAPERATAAPEDAVNAALADLQVLHGSHVSLDPAFCRYATKHSFVRFAAPATRPAYSHGSCDPGHCGDRDVGCTLLIACQPSHLGVHQLKSCSSRLSSYIRTLFA